MLRPYCLLERGPCGSVRCLPQLRIVLRSNCRTVHRAEKNSNLNKEIQRDVLALQWFGVIRSTQSIVSFEANVLHGISVEHKVRDFSVVRVCTTYATLREENPFGGRKLNTSVEVYPILPIKEPLSSLLVGRDIERQGEGKVMGSIHECFDYSMAQRSKTVLEIATVRRLRASCIGVCGTRSKPFRARLLQQPSCTQAKTVEK
ncbi:hypothetical protein B0H17DRAFT_1186280 [Mycena rosella]|uniref:Uncharacterized protein n=1 Tax=Mycena rosella TaxID=1033263 RepID=A0AAD7G3Y6_MYCRO|nr:hypothetical protein B0H17DRAFT_1186280 [Mycena rosella]